jgi:hypothetical protein
VFCVIQAGNVMLTSSNNCEGVAGAPVYALGGAHRLAAKVADFGLAMPLGPTDTHATLMARVSAEGRRMAPTIVVCSSRHKMHELCQVNIQHTWGCAVWMCLLHDLDDWCGVMQFVRLMCLHFFTLLLWTHFPGHPYPHVP